MPEGKSKLKTQNSKVQVKSQKLPAKAGNLSVPVYSLDGKEAGILSLPKELFGVKVNKALLAQAVRVYTSNLKGHFSNTKTRSEVKGSTRKIYKQKGTGGARHGAKSAPIFVGGGIALGPKFRKVVLELPKKMKKAALIAALSARAEEKEIYGLASLEKVSGKTAQMKKFLEKVGMKNVLFVVDGKNELTERAVRNLPGVDVQVVEQINALEVIRHKTLALTREAVEKLESRMKKEAGEPEVKKTKKESE